MVNGIELNSKHTVIDKTKIKNIGFIVAKAGEGESLEPKFTDHIQTAFEIDLPLVALYKPDINGYVYRYQGLEKDWNPVDDAQLSLVKRAFYSGETKRKVHGCIIDLTDIAEGNVLASAGWVVKVGQHLSHYIWNWFKVPTYIYITAGVVKAYPASVNPGQVGVSLDSERVLSTYLSQQEGLCTQKLGVFQATAQDPILFDWDNYPSPPSNYNPSTEEIFSNKIYFSKYSNTKGGFEGIVNDAGQRVAVPLWVWMGNQSDLYSDNNLGFIPTGENTGGETGGGEEEEEEEETGGTISGSADLKRIADSLEIISNYVKKLPGGV